MLLIAAAPAWLSVAGAVNDWTAQRDQIPPQSGKLYDLAVKNDRHFPAAPPAKFVKVYIDPYWARRGGLNDIQVY
jgi:hypothetical protein